MAENSKIEWTDHTFNPWVGCTKVGPPCDHCYAESWAKRSGHPELWQGERRRTTGNNWQLPHKWNAKAKAEGVRRRVFCASLADVFDNQVPSRRPQNIRKMLPDTRTGVKPWGDGWSNVWLGATCGSQAEYKRDWPHLCDVPANVRFISYEPALAPLRIDRESNATLPNWIICGGESGPHARYMEPSWAAELLGDCKLFGVKFFMKQMTGKKPIPPDLMVREFPR